MQDELMTVGEVAQYLKIKPSVIYKWTQRGKLPVVRLSGRAIRFRREAIEEWVKEHEEASHD